MRATENEETSLVQPGNNTPYAPTANEKLALETMLVVARDAIWSHLSYIDTEFWQQELFPIVGMVGLTLLTKALYQICPGRSAATSDMLPTTGGATLSIITWTEGEKLGEQVAKGLGWSDKVAAYGTGAIFAGLADGPVQMITSTVIKLLTQKEEWSKFKNDPTQYWKESIKKFGLSLTVGAIPGAIWQIAFAGGVATGFGAIFTTSLIAVAVATSNALCVKLNERIMQTEFCVNLCGAPEEREKTAPTEEHEAPCVSLWNGVTGLFGCGKPSSDDAESNVSSIQQSAAALMN